MSAFNNLNMILTWIRGSEMAIADGGGEGEAVDQGVALTPHLEQVG